MSNKDNEADPAINTVLTPNSNAISQGTCATEITSTFLTNNITTYWNPIVSAAVTTAVLGEKILAMGWLYLKKA